MSICIRYTKNEDKAKEVLNMGFLKIILNLNKYKTNVPFKAWIRRVMINTLINEYKKEKIHYDTIKYVNDYNETGGYEELNETINEQDADTIYALINQLPQATKQIFNLFFVDGYKHKEIAEMLNISEGTSKWHVNAAKEKLKLLLKKNEFIAHKIIAA
jgi:RNA polymerase sigma factor (sigma-70 family)